MKIKVLIVISSLSILLSAFCIYKITSAPTVRYIKSADLIYGYWGMKEAQVRQQKETEKVQANLDTLKADFQRSINQYNMDFPKLSKEQRMDRERILNIQQDNLKQYAQSTEQSIKQKDEKLTEGVLNQVNAFVETYSKKMGYDLVLGTTASGNILFAKDGLDITDEVLNALNEDYKLNPKQ